VPKEIIEIYGVDLRDPNTGFCVVAIRQYDNESGELRYHLPTLVSMISSLSLFIATAIVILYCIARTNTAIKFVHVSLFYFTVNNSCLQTAVPWFFSYIPLSMILIFPPITGVSLGAFGNILYLITIIFPSIDAFFVLFFIVPFRVAVIRLFRLPFDTSD
ncbi:hypothetical protein PFISCL1PPCAC_14157, partial [Pristionchus fissidentatus]